MEEKQKEIQDVTVEYCSKGYLYGPEKKKASTPFLRSKKAWPKLEERSVSLKGRTRHW